jgi:hypothetical protein
MSGAVHDRLREFTFRLLERRGADVDWPASAGQGLALLPRSVAETLHCLEILPLAAEAGSPLPINLSSDFLDRVEPLVQAEPPVVALQIPTAYLKRSDMAEPVARTFTWLNARVRVQAAAPTRTEYHAWYFLATLDSADRWQQVVRVSVNARSGAQAALPDMLNVEAGLAEPAELPATAPSTQLAAVRAALDRIRNESSAFVERLEGRRGRDRKRLQDYYSALLLGDGKRPGRRGAEEDTTQRETQAKAVRLELRRKLDELDERYACRVDLVPLALIRIDCPALAVQCHVLRRSAARTHTLYWNPLSKALEPMCCSRCGNSTFSIAFSDDKVAPLCAACPA